MNKLLSYSNRQLGLRRMRRIRAREINCYFSPISHCFTSKWEKYAEAEKIYLGLETRFDKTKPEYANLLNNFATLYLVMNKHDKVEEMLEAFSHDI